MKSLHRTFARLLAGVVLLAVAPGETHATPTAITWEQDGTKNGDSNHQHVFDHSFVKNSAVDHHHEAFGVWKNRTYFEVGLNAPANNFGHGFINENVSQPRYRFLEKTDNAQITNFANMNALADDIVNAAFNLWETAADTVTAGNPKLITGLDFDNNQTNFEFGIAFVDGLIENRGALGEWLTLPSQFIADMPGGVGVGNTWWNINLGKPILAFDDDINWLFDNFGGTQTPSGPQRDFATIALHETGHVLGMAHTPGDLAFHLMRASIVDEARNGNTKRVIDIDAANHAAELYTIAVPEPSSLSLFASGLISLILVALRRKVAAFSHSHGMNTESEEMA